MNNKQQPSAILLLTILLLHHPQLNLNWGVILGDCKVFDSCELALQLRDQVQVIDTQEIATWVCIAYHQSALNSAAIGAGGYYGLFQISEEFWCDGWPGANKACGISCSQLTDDDVRDDYQCMQVIYEEHQRISGNGFNAWTSYQKECNNDRAINYLAGCFDDSNYIVSDSAIAQNVNPPVDHRKYQPSTTTTTNNNVQRGDRLSLVKSKASSSAAAVRQSSMSRPRIYERCELAQELVYKHAIPMDQVAMWVCIAQHESNYNTSAIGTLNADGSGDHGLFQISDIYWCSPPGKGWACGLSCDQLEDEDIADDVKCMQQIYKEHQRLSGDGYSAWTVYPLFCKGRAQKYIEGCFVEEDDQENEVFPAPGIIAPLPSKGSFLDATRIEGNKKTGKIYDRCSLAKELVYAHAIDWDKVSTWVCIARHESNFNTSAVGRLNADGSGDHGLFQISDLFWCDDKPLGCGLSCAQLVDNDITDDVACMKKIYAEHEGISGDGFNAWTVYKSYCAGDMSHYTRDCFVDLDHLHTSSHRPGVWQPEEPQKLQESNDVEGVAEEDHGGSEVGKVFTACELAHELMNSHRVDRKDVATWVCIAQHESNFNTSAIGRLNADGSEDHGLFQISDLYWCDDKPYGCGLSCAALRDANIRDDVECIKKIHKEHQRLSGDGFSAWTVYNLFCKGRAEKYVDGCGLRGAGISVFEGLTSNNTSKSISKEKYPFFFSKFHPQVEKELITTSTTTTRKPFLWNSIAPSATVKPFLWSSTSESTTRKPFSWNSVETSTTKKPFNWTTQRPFEFAFKTTTTAKPTFTYPTKKQEFLSKRPWIQQTVTTVKPIFTSNQTRQPVTTKKPEFLSKRPWIQQTTTTTTTTKIPKVINAERDKVDFSIYDLYLKGSKFNGLGINYPKDTAVKATTVAPRISPTTRKAFPSLFTYPTKVPSTTIKPTQQRFTYPTTTTTSTPRPQFTTRKAPAATFNIFDMYLRRNSYQNKLPTQKEEEIKPSTTIKPNTQSQFKLNPHPVEATTTTTTTTTTRRTTFDPFSVYKFNRNTSQKAGNEKISEAIHSKTTTPSTRRNLVHRSPGAYQSEAEVTEREYEPSAVTDSFGITQVTVKPFTLDYIRGIRRSRS